MEITDLKQLLDTLWIIIAAILMFVMQAGFTCLEAGLTRKKNNINVAAKNLATLGVVVAFSGSSAMASYSAKAGLD